MPYIEKATRKIFKKDIDSLSKRIANLGELKYVIGELVGQWIVSKNLFSHSYISKAINAVHETEMELYHRLLVPYEAGEISPDEDIESFQKILEALKFIIGKENYDKRDLGRPKSE